MPQISVLHGPNMNLLGRREPTHYGTKTLAQINATLSGLASEEGVELECFQTNAESEFLQTIHRAAARQTAFLILNPAAWTHTSLALRDALLAVSIPFIEVHLSNVFNRESWRQHSMIADLAAGVIAGLGPMGYELALAAALSQLRQSQPLNG